MTGRGLLRGWVDFLIGLVKGTIGIMSGGGVTQMLVGLIVFAVVAAIVVLPLLFFTSLWLIQQAVGAFRNSESDAT